jgi:hypothetical protein
MEVSPNLTCPCNGKLYKSLQALAAHHKTKGHCMWQQNKEQKDILVKINQLENENGHLRRLNMMLMERITELEKNKETKKETKRDKRN